MQTFIAAVVGGVCSKLQKQCFLPYQILGKLVQERIILFAILLSIKTALQFAIVGYVFDFLT